jgi:hypothetical protein
VYNSFQMKLISLTNSEMFAIVDNEFFEKLTAYSKWCILNGGYVVSTKDRTLMHKFILGQPPKGYECDHIDFNRLNYQKSNLRYVARCDNQRRKQLVQKNNTSGYRGVVWFVVRGCSYWAARIKVDGKQKSLGYFKNKIEAAKAYDAAAKQYHGEFATLNFPEGV